MDRLARNVEDMLRLVREMNDRGGFLGAWLGGIAITQSGDFSWMWYTDIVLAALAAIINLPIREAPVLRATVSTP
jgi:hypothetical protein